VDVIIVIEGGRVTTIRYEVLVSGTPTSVVTQLFDFGAVDPIASPEV